MTILKAIVKKVMPKTYTRIFDEGYLKAEKDKLTEDQKNWYYWNEEKKREIAIRDSKK